MPFEVFEALDKAVTSNESRVTKTPRIPSVWPSNASAVRLDEAEAKIVGSCARASYFRMGGFEPTRYPDVGISWTWVIGRKVEEHATYLLKQSNLLIASGVRTLVRDIYLPLELDATILDPTTNRGIIGECKSYVGYDKQKEITKEGKPQLTNLMQVLIYLNEISTGAKLKTLIAEGLAEQAKPGGDVRNRIEVIQANLDKLDDGPMTAKLLYITRDYCERTEFDIGIATDFDGSRYPTVNGHIWKVFTIESMYERYRELQDYWFAARNEAYRRLEAKNVRKPESLNLILKRGDEPPTYDDKTKEQITEEEAYLDKLGAEFRRLPMSYWPPAEYEWAYPSEKIEHLFSLGLIKKTNYEKWKKDKKNEIRLGDKACGWCNHGGLCIPTQSPNNAHKLIDIRSMRPASD